MTKWSGVKNTGVGMKKTKKAMKISKESRLPTVEEFAKKVDGTPSVEEYFACIVDVEKKLGELRLSRNEIVCDIVRELIPIMDRAVMAKFKLICFHKGIKTNAKN